MKIFIKDIPVIISSNQEFIKTSHYDNIYRGMDLKIDFDQLSGEILIKDATTEVIDKFLVYLKQNNVKKLEEITFTVDDYDAVINDIKKDYTIIKAAGGLILNEGEALMIWRLKKWDLPKGKLDKGEKPKKAAIREVEEECNVKVKLGKKICHTWHTYKQNGRRILKKTYWYRMYCIDDTNMKPQLEENIEEIKWMDESELKEALYNTYPSIRDVFRHYYLMD
ncbi:MAG: NUDIX hydrolase [Cyclobacteriaceae bacterium]|nr:NUDIX hydrolase [Cyclobacteriaceae bacterium]MCK5371593.1 NUDIX hydrolase [Cyclobacteriaceae bacterium]MCK5468253.1 NUDIX hydrolase [Cyclobacteriaceae bacterium]